MLHNRNDSNVHGYVVRVIMYREKVIQYIIGTKVLTLNASSCSLLLSETSGALGTMTGIGVLVLPNVPIEAVLTE